VAAIRALHDHLWQGPTKDEAKLRLRLRKAVADLDRFVRARGMIVGATGPILENFRRRPDGEKVFDFLHAVANLAAAVELWRRDPREAHEGRARS